MNWTTIEGGYRSDTGWVIEAESENCYFVKSPDQWGEYASSLGLAQVIAEMMAVIITEVEAITIAESWQRVDYNRYQLGHDVALAWFVIKEIGDDCWSILGPDDCFDITETLQGAFARAEGMVVKWKEKRRRAAERERYLRDTGFLPGR